MATIGKLSGTKVEEAGVSYFSHFGPGGISDLTGHAVLLATPGSRHGVSRGFQLDLERWEARRLMCQIALAEAMDIRREIARGYERDGSYALADMLRKQPSLPAAMRLVGIELEREHNAFMCNRPKQNANIPVFNLPLLNPPEAIDNGR